MTRQTIRPLALILGTLLPAQFAAAQFAPTDAERRHPAAPTAEDSYYTACLQRRQCADRDDACLHRCGVMAMTFRDKPAGEFVPAPGRSAVPEIVYTSDKGNAFKSWRDAQLTLLYAESAVGSAENRLREETARADKRAQKDELCGRLDETAQALGGIDASDCAQPDSEPAAYPKSRLEDDLAMARIKRDAASRAFADVENGIRAVFPDLADSIQNHRADVSEYTVLKEGADFYYETHCNGRCPN